MSTQPVSAEPQLRTIALASINSNPDNPRKRFDEAALKDLAASIREHGILEPVVVRPDPLKSANFELVVGERRWRAAKLAGLQTIPALVRPYSDRQALEVMVIENLQRVDVHPLEEAAGYRTLLDAGTDNGHPAHTIQTIAERIGKSESYVHARLKLLNLIRPAREAFEANSISAGHAVLIARLQPKDQLRALAACFRSYITGDEEKRLGKLKVSKLDVPETTFGEFAEVLGLPVADREMPDELRVASEKYLRSWIAGNVNLRLKGVPWDLGDATLVPEAGACQVCPKRSLSNPVLFAELTEKSEDVCFDPGCYQSKRQAFVKLQFQKDRDKQRAATVAGDAEFQPLRQLSEQHAYTGAEPDQKTLKQGQWLPAKKGECESVEAGVITKGERAGERRLICANEACKVHKHNLSRLKPATKKAAQSEAEAKADREREERRAAWDTHLYEALRKKVNGPDRAALLLIAEVFIEDHGYCVSTFLGAKVWSEASLGKFRKELAQLPLAKAWDMLMDCLLFAAGKERSLELLETFGQTKKVDLKQLRRAFDAEFEAAEKRDHGQKKEVSKSKSGGAGKPSKAPK